MKADQPRIVMQHRGAYGETNIIVGNFHPNCWELFFKAAQVNAATSYEPVLP